MLELRPVCEHCARLLPPESAAARICSFECTFCSDCAHGVLRDVCPNCGGNFVPRPIRPDRNWKGDNDLAHYPAGATPRHRRVDLDAHAALIARIELELERSAARPSA